MSSTIQRILIFLFILGSLIGCSTGPDYKRDSEYDPESNKYRSGVPGTFSVSITEDALYQLNWSDVANSDGYIIGRHIYGNDTTLYEQIGVTVAYETSFTDSSGINHRLYTYTVTSFVNDGDKKRRGRDSVSLHAEINIGEIQEIDYSVADLNEPEGQNKLLVSTRAISVANSTGDNRFEFQMFSDVVLEYKTYNSDNYALLDTLSVRLTTDDAVYHYVDSVQSPVKMFRAKPILRTQSIKLEGEYSREVTRVVSNPYRLTLNRLDEVLVEYTLTVPENLQSDASLFEGVYLYLNNNVVDTLSGGFPITGILNSKGESENVRVSFEAFTSDFNTNIRSVTISSIKLDKPVITDIYGAYSGTHTVYWQHESGNNQSEGVNSFIVERRDSKDGVFEELAVVGAEVREYQSSDLKGSYYEYRVSTQNSDPSDIVGSRFTTSYEVSKTGEIESNGSLEATSNDLIYRLMSIGDYTFQVYRYYTMHEAIDLKDADFSGNLDAYTLIDASFSEDGRSVAFLLGEKNGISSAAFIYDIDEHDFIYAQNYLKRGNILHLNFAKIAYSAGLRKAVYANKEYSGNTLGIIDIDKNENTTIDFPTGFYNRGDALLPFDDKFVMFNGSSNLIDISKDTNGNMVFDVLVKRNAKVNEPEAILYEYGGYELMVTDLEDYSELKTPVTERVGNMLYYYEPDEIVFHKGPVNENNPRGLYAYNHLHKESIEVSDVTFDHFHQFMQTSDGIKILRDREDYIIRKSGEQKWRKVIRPTFY